MYSRGMPYKWLIVKAISHLMGDRASHRHFRGESKLMLRIAFLSLHPEIQTAVSSDALHILVSLPARKSLYTSVQLLVIDHVGLQPGLHCY